MKKEKKYLIYGIALVLITLIGASLSYFVARIEGDKKKIGVSTADLKIIFTNGEAISGENIDPGWSITKTFSVENRSDDVFKYDIAIEDLVNTFVTEGYLQYKITSSNGYNMTEYKDIPKSSEPSNAVLAYSVEIAKGEIQEYTIEMIYRSDDNVDQSVDMGMVLSGKLYIEVGTNPDLAGTQIALDNVLQSQIPSFNNYNNKLEAVVKCKTGNAKFNYKKWVLEAELGSNCSLTFKDKSINKTYLNDYIISLNNQEVGDGIVTNEIISIDKSTFTAGDKLSQSSYTNLSNDTTYPYTWNDTDKTWTSSNHTDSTTSTISFNVSSTGDYQICYIQQSEKNYDFATIKKDNTEIKSLKGISNTSYECYILGNLSTSNVITISYKKDGSSSTQPDNVVFYLQSGTYNQNIQNFSAGYRYEGRNPNNYILFNDELWRIIGVFDSNTHGVDGNLVKIIRNNEIGRLVYNTTYTVNSWGKSTLYKLLNQSSGGSYYTGIDYTNKSNGTYCSSWYGYIPQDCSFSKTGIKSDYVRNVIEKTKWYSTPYTLRLTAEDVYMNEMTTTTSTEGYIGLMYGSDYGYAVKASDCARTTILGGYSGSSISGLKCAGKNWLLSGESEWILSRRSSGESWTISAGIMNTDGNYAGNSVRPSLYLKSNVYYVGGSGTYDDPIVIGQ